MASRSEALPLTSSTGAIDQAGKWFWNFLKSELSPFPGRAWTVGRMTIAATIVMLLVMTFRLPSGFLAAIFTLFLSRENPTTTLRAGVRVVAAFAVAAAYTIVGITLLLGDPLTHFLWIIATLFIAFYLVRIIPDYGTAVGFGFMTAGAIPLWDEARLSVNARVENTLWLAFAVLIGTAVTIAVEYAFRRVHPTTDLAQGIENRLNIVEKVLRNISSGSPADDKLEKAVSLYSGFGTSRLRRLLYRSGYGYHFIAQMNATVALLGRLVDLAASLLLIHPHEPLVASSADRDRCTRLADAIASLRVDLLERQLPRAINFPVEPEPTKLPFLLSMERTVALIPDAFAGSTSLQEFIPEPMNEEIRERLLVPDAFSNPAHILFAIRGMLAATACYVLYTSIAWPGLSTSIATCIITALSTIGASRQKQFLRLAGTILGGVIFGMGAQIFVLPYLDSIAGFTLVFAVVTLISAWIATSTPRLSYLGVQLALAFYLINTQEFTIQTSLAVARDRVFGVFLGLMFMWLLFDRLWVRNALDEMQAVFSRILEMFAELSEQLLKDDRSEAVKRIRYLRDTINSAFQAVNAQADALLFEFGASRPRKMRIRADVRRWLPSLRTLLLVQITSSQYRAQKPLKELPTSIANAHIAFETNVALVMRAMADDVQGNSTQAPADILASAAKFQQDIRTSYAVLGRQPPPEVSDMFRLSDSLATILSPLYEEIHSTFTNPEVGVDYRSSNRAAPGQVPHNP